MTDFRAKKAIEQSVNCSFPKRLIPVRVGVGSLALTLFVLSTYLPASSLNLPLIYPKLPKFVGENWGKTDFSKKSKCPSNCSQYQKVLSHSQPKNQKKFASPRGVS